MSRWPVVLSLILGCACFFALPVVAADEAPAEVAPAATANTETTGAVPENAPAAEEAFPTKSSIRELYENGKMVEAEGAYLTWANYWQDDDASLIIQIERGVLLEQYRGGKNAALIALAQAGDIEAFNVMTTQVLSGSEWSTPEMLAAIDVISRSGDPGTLTTLRTLLYSKEPAVVNAAIEAIGALGDARIASELYKLFDDADAARCIAVARALQHLGAAKQVRERFTPQLRFPLAGVRENAALALAAVGDPTGWPILHNMLETQKEGYYPLVLTVLDAIPSQESQAFVTKALTGSEAEQLAALKSISLLGAQKVDASLLTILRDATRPLPVRQASVQTLTQRHAIVALKDLRGMAAMIKGEDPKLKASAMIALPSYGLLKDLQTRAFVRQRFGSDEEEVALAARAALLHFAIKATGPAPTK